MKRIITSLILVLGFTMAWAGSKVIKNPEIEYSASGMVITEIEVTKDATIIRGVLKPGSAIIRWQVRKAVRENPADVIKSE